MKVITRLPELQDELQKLIQVTEESLRNLPKPPSQDAFTEILHLIGDFTRDLDVSLDGTPDEEGLLQTIRPFQLVFKRAVRATAPDFRPVIRPKASKQVPSKDSFTFSFDIDGEERQDSEAVTLAFLSNEEDTTDGMLPKDEKNAIYIDEVMRRANQYA